MEYRSPLTEKTCQLCGYSPLQLHTVPGKAGFWLCPQCKLYQYGSGSDVLQFRKDYQKTFRKNRARKLRTATIRLGYIAAFCPLKRPRLLDIGSSIGSTVEAALRRGWRASGVDIDEEAVRSCQERGLDCRVVKGIHLPFNTNTFDIITAWHVIEHLKDVRAALREWHRVLKPDGLLIIETPDPTTLKSRLHGVQKRKFWNPDHTYIFTPQNVIDLFTQNGFNLVSKPLFMSAQGVKPGILLYALFRQSYIGLKQLLKIHNSFQLYALKKSQPETHPPGISKHEPWTRRTRWLQKKRV
jgi:SAM-dependent methyltransferase